MNSKIFQDKVKEIEDEAIEMRLLKRNEKSLDHGEQKNCVILANSTVSLKHYDQVRGSEKSWKASLICNLNFSSFAIFDVLVVRFPCKLRFFSAWEAIQSVVCVVSRLKTVQSATLSCQTFDPSHSSDFLESFNFLARIYATVVWCDCLWS